MAKGSVLSYRALLTMPGVSTLGIQRCIKEDSSQISVNNDETRKSSPDVRKPLQAYRLSTQLGSPIASNARLSILARGWSQYSFRWD